MQARRGEGLEAYGHTVPVHMTPGTAALSETKALLSLHVRLASGEAASTKEAGEMGQLFQHKFLRDSSDPTREP